MTALLIFSGILLAWSSGITHAGRSPKAPVGIRISESSKTSMTVEWEKPGDVGDAPLTSYELFYEYDCGRSFFYCVAPTITIAPDTTSYKLTNLKENSKHKVYVLAVNKYGRSRLGRIKGKTVIKTAAPTSAPPTTVAKTTPTTIEKKTTAQATTIKPSGEASTVAKTTETPAEDTTQAISTKEETARVMTTEASEEETTQTNTTEAVREAPTTAEIESTSAGLIEIPLDLENTNTTLPRNITFPGNFTLPPEESCDKPLGVESGWLEDKNFAATTSESLETKYWFGRLNLPDKAWIASSEDPAPWWQVEFKNRAVVTGIALQGNPTFDYWITKVRLEHSHDGVSWYIIGTFDANTDRDSIVRINFPPTRMQNLMVYALEFNNRASLRAEVYGCDHKMPTCGIRPSETMRRYRRIVGGVESEESSWPWVGAMQYQGETFCTATLITDRWAVTAAHCFNEENGRDDPEGWRVIFGKHSLSKNTAHQQTMLITNLYRHPKHDPSYYFPGRELRYDLALFQLDRAVEVDDKIKPACELNPTVQFDVGDTCYSVGWGRTSPNGPQSDVLRHVKYDIVEGGNCTGDVNEELTQDFICAGSEEGGKGSCERDGGNGVYCERDGYFYLAGIVSQEGDCSSNHKYEKLTNMKFMEPFLKEKIKKSDKS